MQPFVSSNNTNNYNCEFNLHKALKVFLKSSAGEGAPSPPFRAVGPLALDTSGQRLFPLPKHWRDRLKKGALFAVIRELEI